MSSADIGAGARWSGKVAEALAVTKIGILCVTAENQREPWLLFEAGALAKTLDDTFVCPYLIQMRASDLTQGPLTQFQAKLADRQGTLDLVSTVNTALGPDALEPERLRRLFDRSWPHLEKKLKALPASPPNVQRPPDELLTEILETVRSLARRLPPISTARLPRGTLDQSALRIFSFAQSLRDKFSDDERFRTMTFLHDIPDRDVDKVMSYLEHLPSEKLRRAVDAILQAASTQADGKNSNAELAKTEGALTIRPMTNNIFSVRKPPVF